ncbi:MAG: hypothetical protein M1450_01590 [Patescibacteria group bacterium]|nr:hypothetical protein [Patescibacteria group bacterium]
MTKDLKEKAEEVSEDMGFSSLQEAIRVLLNKLAKKEFTLKVSETEKVTHLSKASEKKFRKAIEDIKAGKSITKTENIDELLSLLH